MKKKRAHRKHSLESQTKNKSVSWLNEYLMYTQNTNISISPYKMNEWMVWMDWMGSS